MATLNESKLREDIQSGKLRDFYLISCEDSFKLDHYSRSILEKSTPGESSKEVFYGDELEVENLLEQARSFSLWGERKNLLIRLGERLSAKQWENLVPLILDPTPGVLLVVLCTKVDARFKFIQSLSKAGERAAWAKLEPAQGAELSQWLRIFLKDEEKTIEDSAKQLLLEWAGNSLFDLKYLVARAALFSAGESHLRKAHVEAVGFRLAPEDVFRLTALVLEGDRAGSLGLMERLLRQGEEPLALVGLLFRQYRWMSAIVTSRAEGKNESAIAADAGIFPAAAKVLFPASKRIGGKGVMRGLQLLANTDYALKSSKISKEQLMSSLILNLTHS